MRVKRSISLFLAAFMFLQLFSITAKAEENGIKIEAKSAILMEPNTGKVIYENNSHEKYAPASVTKIMTMLLTMEAVDSGKIKISDKVTASENAKKMGGSTMLLETGEIRTVEEIIKGIAIASGNDAAVAMAEYLGGSEDAFVALMNERCKALGMNDTTFKNCTGLPATGHVSSAYDIAVMSRELLKHPTVLKYTGTYMETISEGRKSPIGLVNHNKLVRFFKGCDGLKTGFTDDAKYCISATAVRDGVRMLSVIMGAPSYKVRNRDASLLLNYGFSKYEMKKVVVKDMELEKIKFGKGDDKYYICKAKDDLTLIIEKGKDVKVTKKYHINKERKEIKKGEVIGECEIFVDGNSVGKVKVYSDRNLKKPGIFEHMQNNLKRLFDNAV